MFSMRYFSPAPALQHLLSSYYVIEFGSGVVTDVLRAELANIRFVICGDTELTWLDGSTCRGHSASLFGPRCDPLKVVMNGPCKIFGAGIMPLGWTALFSVDADELADTMVPLGDVAGPITAETLCRMQNSRDDAALVAAADDFLIRLADARRIENDWFGPLVEAWLIGHSAGGVDRLVESADISSRQVERLCRRYYGAPPKLLMRKYRALRAAVQFSIDPQSNWIDAAGDEYYDQSHFIREFKSFVGMTPTQFAAQSAAIMNHSIRLRRQLPTLPRLSLVS